MHLNTIQIEENLDQLVADVSAGSCSLHEFPFCLMEAYEASRNEVNKLRMKHPERLVATDIIFNIGSRLVASREMSRLPVLGRPAQERRGSS